MSKTLILPTMLLLVIALLLTGCGAPKQHASGPSNAGMKAVRCAYSQLGKKYVSGGASPKAGFDCSGLVYWAYVSNGVKVPRVTTDQARTGRAVSVQNAVPGDILVFNTGGSGTGLHTGMYAGGNSFIHSPKPGAKVRVESIATPYWKKRLVSVRHVGR